MGEHRISEMPTPCIERKRLLGELAQTAGTVFLIGREGSGKTTLAAQFCRGKESVFWYTFEKADNEEHYFLEKMDQMISAQDALGEYRGYRAAGRMVEKIAGLAGEGKGERYFVFDDLQEIRNRQIFDFLAALIRANIPGVHIFLLFAKEPPANFAKLLLTGNVRQWRQQQLWFCADEICALAKLFRGDAGCVQEDVDQIIRLTSGWPVAVFGLLTFLRETPEAWDLLGSWTVEELLEHTLLFRYIQEEIWERLTQEEQSFIRQTLVFTELDIPLCEKCVRNVRIKQTYRSLQERMLLNGSCPGGRSYPKILKCCFQQQTDDGVLEQGVEQAWQYYAVQGDFHRALPYFQILEQQDREWTVQELEWAAELYYRLGNRQRQEYYLNAADSMFGMENKFGAYRSLYRGLYHYEKDPEKYGGQINNALFFLEENQFSLPYLTAQDQKLLEELSRKRKETPGRTAKKKLQVRVFGTFRILCTEENKEISLRTKKTCGLFAYLLECDGRPVERKLLLSELWREEMPNNAVAMLHNMIYNIRKELSYYHLEQIIRYENKAYRMDTGMVDSDLAQIRSLAQAVEQRRMDVLMENAQHFAAYWGRYLEDMDHEWVRERQEYYDRIFEQGCMLLAEAHYQKGDCREANVYYKNAWTLNPYSEKIMGRLLSCCGELKEFKRGRTLYRQFCESLRRGLDAVPSEEFERIYRIYWA